MFSIFSATLNGVTVNIPEVKADSTTLAGVLGWVYIVIGILAVVFIIIGGLRYVLSNGDSKKLEQARNTITYAIVGLVLAILAYAITQFIVQIVDGSSWQKFRDSVINTLIYGVGVISVIMVIVNGFRFTTSAGDPSKAKSAREGVLYAVIGVVIAIVAFSIVNFVLASI